MLFATNVKEENISENHYFDGRQISSKDSNNLQKPIIDFVFCLIATIEGLRGLI